MLPKQRPRYTPPGPVRLLPRKAALISPFPFLLSECFRVARIVFAPTNRIRTGEFTQLPILRNRSAIGVPAVIPTNGGVFLVNALQDRALPGLIWQLSDKVTRTYCHGRLLEAASRFIGASK